MRIVIPAMMSVLYIHMRLMLGKRQTAARNFDCMSVPLLVRAQQSLQVSRLSWLQYLSAPLCDPAGSLCCCLERWACHSATPLRYTLQEKEDSMCQHNLQERTLVMFLLREGSEAAVLLNHLQDHS